MNLVTAAPSVGFGIIALAMVLAVLLSLQAPPDLPPTIIPLEAPRVAPPSNLRVHLVPLTGRASWFGENLRGQPMANGDPCDPSALTCAMRRGSDFRGNKYLVRNRANGRSVEVTLTDWGPAQWTGCTIDLSEAAFAQIGSLSDGHIDVEIFLIREVSK